MKYSSYLCSVQIEPQIYKITIMIKKILLSFVLTLLVTTLPAQIHEWGKTSKLTVEGNHLVDPEGNQVMLHGVMDTPSPYFSGYRFTDNHWIDVYRDGDNYITKCINYFDKLFTAVTDTEQGSWCNVFRLHLDPCWTDNPTVNASGFTTKNNKTYDPNGNEVGGESNIQHFDHTRLSKYLDQLYLPIAKKAQGHGMYIIMRPPGVCPNTIKVGDYYQKYLLTVWDIVSSNKTVQQCSDWMSLELANEPIRIVDANGNESNSAMHDFFQPIVDKIRQNGFKGIIWIPGGTWQQNYRPYAKKPIIDPMLNADGQSAQQIGYAVHFYPGWYNTSDSQTDTEVSIRSFLESVPVVKTAPIMITEVDWSPEQEPKVVDHYNEYGQPVYKNYGTWASGSTSKFGKGFRAIIDHFGNIGWTLTHTHDYLDIDYYLSSQKVRPAFSSSLTNNAYEACSGACFKWYPEYAHAVHKAAEWEQPTASTYVPVDEVTNAADALDGRTLFVTDQDCESIWYVNEGLENAQNVRVGTYEDINENPYCWLKFTRVTNAGCSTTGNLYTIQMADDSGRNYNLWGNGGWLNTPPGTWCLFALGLGTKYGQDANYCGLWKVSYEAGNGYTIQNVGTSEAGNNSWVTPSAATPQGGKAYVRLFSKLQQKTLSLEAVEENLPLSDCYNILGQKVVNPIKGQLYIRNGRKIIIR